MRRFTSLEFVPAETRVILRDRLVRYLPVRNSQPMRPTPANMVADELLLNLLLNLKIVFESEIERARKIYESTLPNNNSEPSFNEVMEAGWFRVVWGRVATPFEIDQRVRTAPPGSMTALSSLLRRRFEESYVVTDAAAEGSGDLAILAAAIRRGEKAPGALRSEDPSWVSARLWDRTLNGAEPHAALLRTWADRWRLLGCPPLVPSAVWAADAAEAFREAVFEVIQSESGLAGWEETRNGFARQTALRTGQTPASGARQIPPMPPTAIGRAEWLGDLRLEGALFAAFSANEDLFGLVRLTLGDAEAEDHAPAPHPVASRVIELALSRPELFAVVLFRARWKPALLADLLLIPETCALACWLIAQWPGPPGAWDQELRARDDLATKAMAFKDAVSVLGHFLERGLASPAETAALLEVVHKTAKPVFGEDAHRSDPILAILREEIAVQPAAVQQAMFAALAAKFPQAGLGTATFAAELDIIDAGELAGAIDPVPLVSAYINAVSAGGYALSANRISIGAAAALAKVAMSAPEPLPRQFFFPIDVKSRIASASAAANPLIVEDETARSIRAHVRVLCRAALGVDGSIGGDLAEALIKAVHIGAIKHEEKGRIAAFSARFETDPYRGLRDRPIAEDLAAALTALGGDQRERLLLAILDIDEPAVLARLLGLAPLSTRDRIARRIANLSPSDAGDIRSLPEAMLRIEELLAAGASDAAAKFIVAERGLKTFGQVPGRELTRFWIDLRLKYARGDWAGIAAAEPPPELSGEARVFATEAIGFYRGLAALHDPAGNREGAEHLFANLHRRHPEIGAYAVNLFAARLSRLLGNDLFGRLQGDELIRGRKALVEAEHSLLRVRNLSAMDQEIFTCNKALLLLALGQPNQASEILVSMAPLRLRTSAAAYNAVALSRMGRTAEAVAVLDEADAEADETGAMKAAREHIQTGGSFTASANLSSDDELKSEIQKALFLFGRMEPSEQAAILMATDAPLEKLITKEIRAAAARVMALAPMMTNVTIDSCEDDLSAHLREVIAAQVAYLGWSIPDQSKGGRTAKGRPGERDLLVQKDGITRSVVEAVVCARPVTQETMRRDLASHFQRLFAYDGCTVFFHLTYAYVANPSAILDYLKEMAQKEAPSAFKYQRLEDIPHTDAQPPGFAAEYEGRFGPVKVVFLVLDMGQEAQKEAAQRSAATNPR
jgi:hypothetical protein